MQRRSGAKSRKRQTTLERALTDTFARYLRTRRIPHHIFHEFNSAIAFIKQGDLEVGERFAAILPVIAAGETISETARSTGYHRNTIRRWVQLYREGRGVGGLCQRSPSQFKQRVASLARRIFHAAYIARSMHPEWSKAKTTRWIRSLGFDVSRATVYRAIQEVEDLKRGLGVRYVHLKLLEMPGTEVRVTGDFLDWCTPGMKLEEPIPGHWTPIPLPPGEYEISITVDGLMRAVRDDLAQRVFGGLFSLENDDIVLTVEQP